MKRKITGMFIFIAFLSGIAWAVLNTGSVPDNNTPVTGALPKPDLIRTATPQRKDFSETCHWFGKVESRDKTKIVALETGRIVSMVPRDGMPVTKGELLFTIGGPLINSRQEVLRNKSDSLRERMTLAEQMVKIKRVAVSQKFAKYEELASAEDAMARLKTELESAGQEIKRLQEGICVRAGVKGVFTNRKVSAGQEVQKGDDMAEIISRSHLYIAATLFPKGDTELKNRHAVINLPEERPITGTVTSVVPQRTAGGATVVWIEGPDLAPTLRPGQTVTGTVLFSVHKRALALPRNAIVRDEKERAYVFIEDSSGYRRQLVKTGMVSDGWVEIVSGLTEEDKVVVRGAYELFYRDFNRIYKVVD